MENTMIQVNNLSKQFILHNQGGAKIDVFNDLSFTVQKGQCTALYGKSGSGKSTLLRSLYANYKPYSGHILIRKNNQLINLTQASPREVVAIRKSTIGYVSQFLRVIPRVPTLEIVAAPYRELYGNANVAKEKAQKLLTRLNIPERLWSLAPATFSGGEQQRVNIARSFIVDYPILLLDEPTASLDYHNSQTVVKLIEEAKTKGTAIVGIFHDDDVRTAVSTHTIKMNKPNSLGENNES